MAQRDAACAVLSFLEAQQLKALDVHVKFTPDAFGDDGELKTVTGVLDPLRDWRRLSAAEVCGQKSVSV